MAKRLIISLGGSPEPILYSIRHHRPDEVYFFASAQSVEGIGELKRVLREEGRKFGNQNFVVEDANSLEQCYEKAVALADQVDRMKGVEDEVVIDATGGTKPMSAALILAGVGRRYRHSYVGGSTRTKDGLGIVVLGSEELKTGVDPWEVFAVEEKKRIGLYCRSFQFAAAIQVAHGLSERVGASERLLFGHLAKLLEGYKKWDCFQHKPALEDLKEGAKGLAEYLAVKSDIGLSGYLAGVNDNIDFLITLGNETNWFKKLAQGMVVDLLSNARRRYEEGKFDDGVARLYRSLEMIGQVSFERHFHCSTSRVPSKVLPDVPGWSWRNREKRDGTLELGLQDAFKALAAVKAEVGLSYEKESKAIDGLLLARNQSILAHGTSPVKSDTFEKLEGILKTVFPINETVAFPELRW